MTCPACRTLIDEGLEFCPACLGALDPKAVAAPPLAPPQVEPVSFAERFPAEQPCAEHPAFPIAGTCPRCGRFVCIRCAPDLATKATADCADCAGFSTRSRPAPHGIGGWLILVAIAVVLGPVGMGLRAGIVFLELARDHARAGHLLVIQWEVAAVYAFGAAIAVYQLGVAVAFFARKRFAPRLIIAAMALYVVFCLVRLLVETGADSLVAQNSDALMRSLVPAAIWIPYLLVSKRVKATFVT
jgi:hypothetical protein